MPHLRLGETVCAYLVLQPGVAIDLPQVAAHLQAAGLAKQKIPERLELVEELQRTLAGKVRKNHLRDMIAAKLAEQPAPPRT